MVRNTIKNDFWTSKMAASSQFLKNIYKKGCASDFDKVQTYCWPTTTWYKFTFGQYIYSKMPLSDHSPGATMPLLRPLFYSPDFSPMLSTVKLFYSATIPLFQFATTHFSPKPHIFPILRPHRRRTRLHRQGMACSVCLITLANQRTTQVDSLSRLWGSLSDMLFFFVVQIMID